MNFPVLFSIWFLACTVLSGQEARILGTVPDGSPLPPSPPLPGFSVEDKDVFRSTSIRRDGRVITMREIKPVALPEAPKLGPMVSLSPAEQIAFSEQINARRELRPRQQFIFLGATVYISKTLPTRSFVRCRVDGNADTAAFWSSADFSLLAGLPGFIDKNGRNSSIFMMWSKVDLDRMGTLLAARGGGTNLPNAPDFSGEKASFTFVGASPGEEGLLAIQSLHDIYNTNHAMLLRARNGREAASRAREADLLANPPKPGNIVLNYWNTGSAPTAPAQASGRREDGQ